MCEVLNKAFVNVFTREAVFTGDGGKFTDTKDIGGERRVAKCDMVQ